MVFVSVVVTFSETESWEAFTVVVASLQLASVKLDGGLE